jgi:hypothetical protein
MMIYLSQQQKKADCCLIVTQNNSDLLSLFSNSTLNLNNQIKANYLMKYAFVLFSPFSFQPNQTKEKKELLVACRFGLV